MDSKGEFFWTAAEQGRIEPWWILKDVQFVDRDCSVVHYLDILVNWFRDLFADDDGPKHLDHLWNASNKHVCNFNGNSAFQSKNSTGGDNYSINPIILSEMNVIVHKWDRSGDMMVQ